MRPIERHWTVATYRNAPASRRAAIDKHRTARATFVEGGRRGPAPQHAIEEFAWVAFIYRGPPGDASVSTHLATGVGASERVAIQRAVADALRK